MFNLSTFFENY